MIPTRRSPASQRYLRAANAARCEHIQPCRSHPARKPSSGLWLVLAAVAMVLAVVLLYP